MVRDPQTGKYRRTRLFVLTLGYSLKSVRLLAWRSSARTWAELHEKAFRRLGGSPRVVVLDNLREGVAVPGYLRSHRQPTVPRRARPWDELHVRILHPSSNQLLREYLRQKPGGYRIKEEDHPKKCR